MHIHISNGIVNKQNRKKRVTEQCLIIYT